MISVDKNYRSASIIISVPLSDTTILKLVKMRLFLEKRKEVRFL